MKLSIKSSLFGVLAPSLLLLNGCTLDSVVDDPKQPDPINIDLSEYEDQYEACPKVTAEDVRDCDKEQGVLQREGLMGCYMCVVSYSDAGQSCQDNSDCDGICKASQGEFLPAGTPNQTGECSSNSSPFGCYQTIENGVLQPALCID